MRNKKRSQKFCIIKIESKPMGKFLYVSSPELPGLCLLGHNHEELFENMPILIKVLFQKNYDMEVTAIMINKGVKL